MRITELQIFDPRTAYIATSPTSHKVLAALIGTYALGTITLNAAIFARTSLRKYTPLFLIPATLIYLTLLHVTTPLALLSAATLLATYSFFYYQSRPKKIPLPPVLPFRPKKPLNFDENGHLIIHLNSVKGIENSEVKRYIDRITDKTYFLPPLHFAILKKSPPVLIQYALDQGYDPYEKDSYYRTAFDYIEKGSPIEKYFINRGFLLKETDSSHGSSDDEITEKFEA